MGNNGQATNKLRVVSSNHAHLALAGVDLQHRQARGVNERRHVLRQPRGGEEHDDLQPKVRM